MGFIIALFAIFLMQPLFSSANALGNIEHVQLDETHLIATGPVNYGIFDLDKSNSLEANSINADEVLTVTSDCKVMARKRNTMTESERNELATRRTNFGIVTGSVFSLLNGYDKYSQIKLSPQGEVLDFMSKKVDFDFIMTGSPSAMENTDDEAFTFSRPNMGNNLARVFQDKSMTAFVLANGRVEMKPTACLSKLEKDLVDQVKAEMLQEKSAFEQEMKTRREEIVDEFKAESDELKRDFESSARDLNEPEEKQFREALGSLQNQVDELARQLS